MGHYSVSMPLREPMHLRIGDVVTRGDLAIEYGGAVQGGIIASKVSGKVFIFTDPSEGNQFGYVYDGFSPDGTVLHYTGAGQEGDQLEKGANSPILTHAEKGRTLHAFVADGKVPGAQAKRQRYLGEFFLDTDVPFERMPAPDRFGASRTVIVFRLRPLASVPADLLDKVGFAGRWDQPRSVEVPAEINSSYFFETAPRAGGSALRKESILVEEFIADQQGHDFARWAIKLPDERAPLLTDVYDKTDRVLYEAKAGTGRAALRMAVGQLLDYRRHVEVVDLRCSVLLPDRPSADLRNFIGSVGLDIAFKENERFSFIQAAVAA